ncbi:site-specific DNA recombinase [Streptomyces canus]|uniref:Site-specific DNA recombinase n=1 Tax=Streptomyces canus TaxID=58343 RepID=A0AAW8FCJ6_9ACTN|nr:recombinase family protein [Streptomyces canus]MDQ0907804.1 site-specific DNA recombinase [Streptomyces canus]
MTARRALGVIRLSVGGLNQTGEDTQKKKITNRCIADELDFVDFATDVDVSASYSPWNRPQLGEWLNNRVDEFDVLVVYKLDRIVRSVRDLTDLLDWLDKHNKSLISIEEAFDFSTTWGKMVAKLLAVLAEAELEAIKARIQASREAMRAKGRWPGGLVPFGRVAVPAESGDGYTLELCPKYGPWLLRMIEKFLELKSFTAVAGWLNENNVPTSQDIARMRAAKAGSTNTRLVKEKAKPRGAKWTATGVQAVITSRNLLGEYTRRDGTVERNPDGTPVIRSVPVLTQEKFDELQSVVATVKFTKGPQRTSPYLGVLFCTCGKPLYYVKPYLRRVNKKGQEVWSVERFRCQGEPAKNIKPCKGMNFKAEEVRAEIKRVFLQALKDKPVMEKRVTMDDGPAMQMAVLDARLDQLTDELKAGHITAAEYGAMMASTAVEREGINKSPVKSVVKWTATGESYGDWWERSTEQGRREKLVSWGVKVTRDTESMTLDIGTQIFEGLKLGGEAFEEPVILSHRTEYEVLA